MSPKGTKEKLKAAATLRNMSVSEFVLSCVTKELEKMKE
nr:MAG TPA: Transcriptional regulator, RHH-like, CopG [Bacteriophage sp.]